MTINQKHLGGATRTVLTSAMTPTTPGVGGTFTVGDRTGWPPSGNVPAKIDPGTASEEKVLLSDTSTTTFTISQRGYDGTTARDHGTGAEIELCLPAAVIQSTIDHVDDVEADPHSTKLLNNTRHDVTARHAFGAALGTPGTPTALTPDIAGAAGTAAQPARADHVHNVPAATATTITGSNAEGASSSFARADHNHAYGAASIVAGSLAAGGVSATNQIADAIITLAKFASEAGTSFDPVFSAVTLGAGGKWGAYLKLGRLFVAWFGFTLGAGGSVGGTITATMPFSFTDLSGGLLGGANAGPLFAGRAFDQSAGSRWSGLGFVTTGGTATTLATAGASAAWDNNTPFTWANGDILQCLCVGIATT
jgi:hypothetical protein